MDALIPVFDKNAVYIWACYGIAFLGVASVLLATLVQARIARRQMEQAEIMNKAGDQ